MAERISFDVVDKQFHVLVVHGKWTRQPTRREQFHYQLFHKIFADWLDSPDTLGFWDAHSDYVGIHFTFTNPDTAFAFKLRFG